MKKQLIVIMILLISINAECQVKKNIKYPSAKSEIDKLYERYKDLTTITLNTPLGSIEGKVSIVYNKEGKPTSVRISGETSSEEVLTEFLENTIKMKKRQGYKNNENEIFQIKYLNQILTTNYLMKKGAMYFIVHSENCTEIKDKYQLDKELAQQKGYAKLGIEHPINLKNEVSGCYSWYIETGCKYPINRTTLN